MKEKYLETEKYPVAEFQLTKLILPTDLNSENVPFEGILQLHGVKKPITGKVNSQAKGNRIELS